MSSTSDKLKKAYILAHDAQGREINDPIKVLFNPEQYSIEKSNQFASMAIPGRGSPVIQFVRGEAETLSLDIFFDTYTYYNGEDVRNYTEKIAELLKIKGDTHAPPVCTFHWGTESFTGIIERISKRFTMFKEDGVPVRATLTLTFRQYSSLEKPKESPDRTKIRIVEDGDSLWLFAALEYGDPSKWKIIASANDEIIENPRLLTPGTEIRVPPLPDRVK
jgi:hypothetical protein